MIKYHLKKYILCKYTYFCHTAFFECQNIQNTMPTIQTQMFGFHDATYNRYMHDQWQGIQRRILLLQFHQQKVHSWTHTVYSRIVLFKYNPPMITFIIFILKKYKCSRADGTSAIQICPLLCATASATVLYRAKLSVVQTSPLLYPSYKLTLAPKMTTRARPVPCLPLNSINSSVTTARSSKLNGRVT